MRDAAWDYARGIGIVLVVFGHVLTGLVNNGVGNGARCTGAADYALYTFHMPLFFFLAGIGAASRIGTAGFLTGKLATIVYPYFLWSLIQGGMQIGIEATPALIAVPDLMRSLLLVPDNQFWFLYALMLCHLLGAVSGVGRIRLCSVAIAAYLVSLHVDWGMVTPALSFFRFYALGILLVGPLRGWLEWASSRRGLALSVSGFAAALYGARQLGGYTGPWAMPAAVLGTLATLQLATLLARNGRASLIERLGMASMPIYAMHILATSATRTALLRLGVTDLYLHLAVGVALGLALPMAAYYVLFRAGKERHAGFARATSVFRPLRRARQAAGTA